MSSLERCPSGRRSPFDWAPIPWIRDVKVVSDTFDLGSTVAVRECRRDAHLDEGSRRTAVWTGDVDTDYSGPRLNLADILEDDADVPAQFFVDR